MVGDSEEDETRLATLLSKEECRKLWLEEELRELVEAMAAYASAHPERRRSRECSEKKQKREKEGANWVGRKHQFSDLLLEMRFFP